MARTTLLKTILAHVTQLDASPQLWRSELRAIARGEVDSRDVRDMCHSLFDWYTEVSNADVNDADAALLAKNPDDETDPQARKQLLRRQRKAAKRAKAAQRTFTSKVTPKIVDAVQHLLDTTPGPAAADKLGYVTVVTKELDEGNMVRLIEAVSSTRTVYTPVANPIELHDTLAPLTQVSVRDRVSVLEHVWLAAHAPYTDTAAELDTLRNAASGAGPVRRLSKRAALAHIVDNEGDASVWQRTIGVTLASTDLLGHVNMHKLGQHQAALLAAADVPYVFTPPACYRAAATAAVSMIDWVTARRGDLGAVDTFDDIVETYRMRCEFNVPAGAVLVETHIGECVVTTITDTPTLKANGEHMGNCTYSSYRHKYLAGSAVLFKVVHNGSVYNTEIARDARNWTHRETKGRQNNPAPAPVRAAAQELVGIVEHAANTDPTYQH